MPKLKENIPLSKFSHYKIGGPARYFFAAKNEADVRWAVRQAKKLKLPLFILGGGTNLLINDDGFAGLVLKPGIGGIKMKGTGVTAGAGVMMADLLRFAMAHSLAGIEWAGGLPGTVGGAVRGNAGCFGGEIKDSVVSVRSFNIKTMKAVTRTGRECRFAYRDSLFKKTQGNEIILSVTFALTKGNKKEIGRVIKKHIAYRAAHHPLEHPNIGSIFKNVPLHTMHKKGSIKYSGAIAAGSLTLRGSSFSVKMDPFPVISSAKFIGETGLRGVSAGGAMISPKHPNFIVNALGARALDVHGLIALTKAEVRKKFGVGLEEEVQLV